MNKIKHHLFLANMTIWFIGVAVIMALAVTFSLWLFLFGVPLLIIYLFGFWWAEHTELVCPTCHYMAWDKTNYFCPKDGNRLVFRQQVKVKRSEPIPEKRVAVLICSKGHTVNAYDKFCPKCGEAL